MGERDLSPVCFAPSGLKMAILPRHGSGQTYVGKALNKEWRFLSHSNEEVLAIAKDPLGAMATRIDGSMVHGTSPATQIPRLPYAAGSYTYGEQLAKPLAAAAAAAAAGGDDSSEGGGGGVVGGEWAVLLLNRLNTTTQIVLNFLDVGDTSVRCFNVRDLWSHEELGVHELTFDGGLIQPHGCRMLRLAPYMVGANCTLQ